MQISGNYKERPVHSIGPPKTVGRNKYKQKVSPGLKTKRITVSVSFHVDVQIG